MNKKILICGIDGYLGWPTAMHLSRLGNSVHGLDNFSKKKIEEENNISPLINIQTMSKRVKEWKKVSGNSIKFYYTDLTNYKATYDLLKKLKPDVIIHYGEQPSAPYSMIGREQAHFTQSNNVTGTLNLLFAIKKNCSNAHLIKLGTMGVYGTPNIEIEEGYLDVTHKGRKDKVLFPMKPQSFYHLSKAHDSLNIAFACRVWGLRATDLNQGVVYGTDTVNTKKNPNLITSFHYDHLFGTVINRFIVEAAIEKPITVYGKGEQQRTFLNINDTMKCVELAIKYPPKKGEYQVRNQFTEIFSINQLASLVASTAKKIGINSKIEFIKNPRVEMNKHFYKPTNKSFLKIGLKPIKINDNFIIEQIKYIQKNLNNIDIGSIKPTVKWNQKK
jgi:UDP-sulfoquinovose synthase